MHYNSPEPFKFQAFGYALSEDIYLAPGREADLSHELWHVVQQKQGRVRPTKKFRGKYLNTDSRLEQEADRWQSMDSLRYPQRQEVHCMQRVVFAGVGDETEWITYDTFLEKLAEYCYKYRRGKENIISQQHLEKMLLDAYQMICDYKDPKDPILYGGELLLPVYSFASYDDLFAKLLLKHRR